MLELRRTADYGKTMKTVANKIYSFGLGGRFLFASVMTGKVSIELVIIRHPQAKYSLFRPFVLCKKKLQSTQFEIQYAFFCCEIRHCCIKELLFVAYVYLKWIFRAKREDMGYVSTMRKYGEI